jgi:hypothetical protein
VTIELTRRWFVFGSVAAVAAAPIPSVVAPSIVPEPMPSAHVYLRRVITELQFGFVDVPANVSEAADIRVFVHRNGGRAKFPHIQLRMNVHSSFIWNAPWNEGFVVLPQDTFEIVIDSNQRIGKFFLVADDTVDEGPPITVCETHDWPQVEPVQPMFLHADNSLEARIARKNAKPVETDWGDYNDEYEIES